MRHEEFRRRALAALAALPLVLAAAYVSAQENESETAEEPPATPQPGAQTIPWDTACSQAARSAEPNCEMSQMVIVPKSRQVLLRVEIEVPGDGSGPRMVLRLPHGLYLPAGVTLKVDDEDWRETEVQTCDGQGCYAGVELDDDVIARLERGEQLMVGFQSLSRETVTVPVDLKGFTASYAKIR
jgi:invasion protein IalB